ncbi:cellulose synthase/poly-beta-1,6-N-acetylglucosamine synthase-like glycosyltransferase [Paenibacillus sp. V4I7]|nr:cellulose synthase/poly-beta-1,6-N-acetylglucosamine synthase-like glycosyltransferase [Paenibacillus sp. V4I7]MDQ0917843.1 cellulose synthase/poly-beta-1,6-N-acetylglucosamine synthase-like glycosyltransferase [Paenibacillus sp. V4I5]
MRKILLTIFFLFTYFLLFTGFKWAYTFFFDGGISPFINVLLLIFIIALFLPSLLITKFAAKYVK